MFDHDTSYQEGMNYNGMVIITTSLTPDLADETDKEDGAKILKALHMKSQEEAVNFLIKEKMTGFIFVATPEKLMLIEAARKDHGEGEYKAKLRVIPKNEIVVGTNHGVDFPGLDFKHDSHQEKMFGDCLVKKE
jgi:hypothetical protein